MRANKHLLLWTSLGSLLLLGWAAYQENYRQEWRLLQAAYRDRLPPARREEFGVQLRQVVVPALDAADRCVTCHVGMAPGETAPPGDRVFGPHPDVFHDTAQYGCTICHGGQGRATVKADAHGSVPHWPEPMIPRRYAYAGCGSCHTHLAVPDVASLERGQARFERYDCLACHRMEGRGGTLRPGEVGGMEGPDLSAAGARGYDRSWYAGHLAHLERERASAGAGAVAGAQAVAGAGAGPGAASGEGPGPWSASFGEVAAADLPAIDVYLSSRVGAPGLVEAKALFHSLGCRGCHSIAGVGGDDGPDLTAEGRRDPGRLDFSGVRSGRGLTDWLRDHFKAPARVVSGSAMPEIGPTDAQIDQLTFYILSLRRADQAAAFWPKDRILAERFNEREFATDGQALYGTYCAACHGQHGEGMRFPGVTAFPAIASPDFLALASNEFIKATVQKGRPGRRMPAWGEKEGGLRPREVEAVVAHLRRLGGGVDARPDPRPARWARGDGTAGARLYADACGSCHGASGEGGEGPALNNRVLLQAATDTYLFETIRQGRSGTSMAAFSSPSPARRTLEDDEIEAIVTHIRSWEVER